MKAHFCNKTISKNYSNILVVLNGSNILVVLFSKVAVLRPATLPKRDCNTDGFELNFAKILRAPILKNICKRV